MARRVRVKTVFQVTEDGAEFGNFQRDTGNKTYTEGVYFRQGLAASGSTNLGLGGLTQGNYVYVRVTTGPVRLTFKNASINSTNSHTFLTNGFAVYSNITFAGLRFSNQNGSSQTTLEAFIAGD